MNNAAEQERIRALNRMMEKLLRMKEQWRVLCRRLLPEKDWPLLDQIMEEADDVSHA